MVYDKTGPWRPDDPGPHAPYSYADEALEYWTKERKIPMEKLTLGSFSGMPHYFYQMVCLCFQKNRWQKILAWMEQAYIVAVHKTMITMTLQTNVLI